MPDLEPAASLPFDFCTITGRFDTAPEYHHATLGELADYLRSHVRLVSMTREAYLALSKPEQAHVKDGPAIILARFKAGAKRTDENVEVTTGIGLDIDVAHIEFDVLRAIFSGFAAIIYESANSTNEFRRWRVLLPYSRPASLQEHEQAFDYWCNKLHGIGQQSRNASRLWYGVTQFAKARKRIFETLEGKAFDPVMLAKPASAIAASKAAFKRSITLPADAPAAEGSRNEQMNRYATSMLHRCGTITDLLTVMLIKNNEYAPPLPPEEVRAIAAAKWKKRSKFVHVEISAGIPTIEDDADVGIDANALLDTDVGEVPWLVQDLMTHGAHLLVGRPKGGKSWITMDMAYACGNGGSFLDLPARRTDVLWIASEDTQASLARRLKLRGERLNGTRIMTMEALKEERTRWDNCTFDAWLRGYLETHPAVGLVIMDTHSSVEALWQSEQIDVKRHASVVDIAYQKTRLYEDIGQETQTCIVLVHHSRKRNGKDITDYHELINMAQTVVAGAAASLVLADPPDRDVHDEDDHRRIFAMRGRNIVREVPLLIELKTGRARRVDEYREFVQSQTQAEIFTVVEDLLQDADTCTIAQVAAALGKHKNTVQRGLQAAAKRTGGMQWKGRTLVLKQGRGLFWDR